MYDVDYGADDDIGADGDNSDYHLLDDSQLDLHQIILETECPSLDDLNFIPGVHRSHVSASEPSLCPQLMHIVLPPCFFLVVSRPSFLEDHSMM